MIVHPAHRPAPCVKSSRGRLEQTVLYCAGRLAAAALCSALLALPAAARCRPQGPPVTTDIIDAFIAKPTLLLLSDATSQRDANAMAVTVSQYVAADPSAIPALVSVLPQASIDQRSAIGRGLYRTVDVCAAIDQAVVRRTEIAVRKISDATVVNAYRTAELGVTGSAGPSTAGDLPAGPAVQTAQSLIGELVTNNPMSTTLSNPFVLPGIR